MNRDSDRTPLRRHLRAQCARLPARERAIAAAVLVQSLERLPEFLVDTRIAGYWAVRGEMPLHAAFASLQSRAQTYCLPILAASDALQFAPWQPGIALTSNRFGIPEPDLPAAARLASTDLDVVLLPLVGFDRRGNRLGSGGGWYDRSFAFLRDATRPARPLLVGIGYHFQEIAAIEPEPWDVRMDYVATDHELIACNGSPE